MITSYGEHILNTLRLIYIILPISVNIIDIYIKEYKLMDLSGNGNHGEIINCEITELEFEPYKEVKIPYRRESKFGSLFHEGNGFLDNRWKQQSTRWNQLRFQNEVLLDDNLIKNDGLSTLEFIEHGRTHENKITHINIGI